MAKRPKQRPVDTRTDIEKESDRLLQDIQINAMYYNSINIICL